DENRKIEASYEYFPFGGMKTESCAQLNAGFTGKERDAAAGLDYMLARYYSSSLGRFMTVDPSGDMHTTLPNPTHWNRFMYVLNDPLNYDDPDGERENPVTRGQGIDTIPHRGMPGAIRSSVVNPNIGKFGYSRFENGAPKYHPGLDINAAKGTPLY